MNIQKQTSPERIVLGQKIESFCTGMLTFCDESGALISQPMAPIEMDANGVIWFFTDSSSEKTKFLDELNLTFSGESDGLYVSLSGSGEMDFNEDNKKELWSPMVKPWFPDGPGTPALGLLKFAPHTAEYWDTPHSKVIRLLAIAASIVAAKPIGLGDHIRLNEL
jgi:general stress protein 26